MIFQPTAKALNHLFEQNSWAFGKLQPFATRTIQINLLPLSFTLLIQADGSLAELKGGGGADVVCDFLPTHLPRLALHDVTVFQDASMTGDAALIEVWRLVLSNLSWDVAEDLSRLTGDVVAEKVVGGVQDVLDKTQIRDKLLHLAQFTPTVPAGVLVKQSELTEFASQVEALNQALAQLEQRVYHLSQSGKS